MQALRISALRFDFTFEYYSQSPRFRIFVGKMSSFHHYFADLLSTAFFTLYISFLVLFEFSSLFHFPTTFYSLVPGGNQFAFAGAFVIRACLANSIRILPSINIISSRRNSFHKTLELIIYTNTYTQIYKYLHRFVRNKWHTTVCH